MERYVRKLRDGHLAISSASTAGSSNLHSRIDTGTPPTAVYSFETSAASATPTITSSEQGVTHRLRAVQVSSTSDAQSDLPNQVGAVTQHEGLFSDDSAGPFPAMADLQSSSRGEDPSFSALVRSDTLPRFPYNPSNVFDNTLNRGLLYKVIDLYFDYRFPLVPIIHRPSFIRDIHRNREDLPGQDEWISLVLSLVSATISHLPRALLPISSEEAKALAWRCFVHAWGCEVKGADSLSLIRCECSPLKSKVLLTLPKCKPCACARFCVPADRARLTDP
jgi:hypothetical protein